MKRFAFLALALTAVFPAHAADTQAVATQAVSTTAGNTQRTPSATDATTRELARIWGLTVDEILRYQVLMRGYRGSVSVPNISPIEVLGIHARDAAERRRYAELLARIMVEDAQRVLDFERERVAAMDRLYPNLKVMDYGRGDGSLRPAAKGR
jgi:integrating conjugative element protein (TIGR03759 family)